MRNRSISSIKSANRGDGSLSEEVGRIVVNDRAFVVVLAPKPALRSVPGQTCRFKIDGFEFAAIETPDRALNETKRTKSRAASLDANSKSRCWSRTAALRRASHSSCGSASGPSRPTFGASSPSSTSPAGPRWSIVARH